MKVQRGLFLADFLARKARNTSPNPIKTQSHLVPLITSLIATNIQSPESLPHTRRSIERNQRNHMRIHFSEERCKVKKRVRSEREGATWRKSEGESEHCRTELDVNLFPRSPSNRRSRFHPFFYTSISIGRRVFRNATRPECHNACQSDVFFVTKAAFERDRCFLYVASQA